MKQSCSLSYLLLDIHPYQSRGEPPPTTGSWMNAIKNYIPYFGYFCPRPLLFRISRWKQWVIIYILSCLQIVTSQWCLENPQSVEESQSIAFPNKAAWMQICLSLHGLLRICVDLGFWIDFTSHLVWIPRTWLYVLHFGLIVLNHFCEDGDAQTE